MKHSINIAPDATTFLQMCDRLHRAALLFRGGMDFLGAKVLWPDVKPETGDYSHGEITLPAEFVRVMAQWEKEIPKARPGEIDRAFRDILLLQGCDKLSFKILTLRAHQEHGTMKESWRKIAVIVGIRSKDTCIKKHRDLILYAMEREARQKIDAAKKVGRAA